MLTICDGIKVMFFLITNLLQLFVSGPFLDESSQEWNVPLLRAKDKQVLVACVQEAMLNLLPSAKYLSINIDTHMGYMIGIS